MEPIRRSLPVRTCKKHYANYRSYKSNLRNDFNRRCGYCDDLDIFCGGSLGFHIDHFRPKAKFKHRENDYENLVYACPYCNGTKSDDWPSDNENQNIVGDEGYIDPCDSGYDEHFERYSHGRIRPKTPIGKYMFKKLKLGLRRHQLAWAYTRLDELLQEFNERLNEFEENDPIRQGLLNHHFELTTAFLKYKNMFEETI